MLWGCGARGINWTGGYTLPAIRVTNLDGHSASIEGKWPPLLGQDFAEDCMAGTVGDIMLAVLAVALGAPLNSPDAAHVMSEGTGITVTCTYQLYDQDAKDLEVRSPHLPSLEYSVCIDESTKTQYDVVYDETSDMHVRTGDLVTLTPVNPHGKLGRSDTRRSQ